MAEFDTPHLELKEVLQLPNILELIDRPGLPFDSGPYITITTKDGRNIEDHVDYASGAPQNPLLPELIVTKFATLASRTFPAQKCLQLQEKILTVQAYLIYVK
ncbi:MAG: hypothetical protein ACI8ZB_003878 [Desulforhopalus sp.]|jgi:hypothetical protein